MNKSDLKIIKSILEKYIELNNTKYIFNNKYFNLKEENLIKVLNVVNEEICSDKVKNKGKQFNDCKISSEIKSIKDEKDVEEYYINNLKYNHDKDIEKKKVLKNISSLELKYLYRILYREDAKNNSNKTQLLEWIEQYFEIKYRDLSMKI